MSQVRAVLRGGVWDGEDLAAGPRPPLPRCQRPAPGQVRRKRRVSAPGLPGAPAPRRARTPSARPPKPASVRASGRPSAAATASRSSPATFPSARVGPPPLPPRPPHGLRAPWHGRQALPTPRPRVPADVPPCQGEDCAGLNCSWAPWGPWAECSRSCGVGRQQRLRAYSPPGAGGRWCPGILSAFVQRRFCSLQACKGGGRTGGGRHPEGLCSAPGGPWE